MKNTRPVSWLAQQYCQSVASALLARNEFFELLEDATTPAPRLARARATWNRHERHAQTLKGMVGTA